MKTTVETGDNNQRKAALAILLAVSETIREAGECPSGPLYAALMSKISIEQYEMILSILKRSRLIEISGHLIKWVGPLVAPESRGSECNRG